MTTAHPVPDDPGRGLAVLAVRYGTRQATAREVFLNYHAYGEPDRTLGMDYFFWVVRDEHRTVVVDCGCGSPPEWAVMFSYIRNAPAAVARAAST